MDNNKLGLENLYPYFKGKNSTLRLMNTRIGNLNLPDYKPDTVQGAIELSNRLASNGGFSQQDRMIRQKRNTLDKATLYSYQGALVKKQSYDFQPLMEGVREADPVRALINPNKLKQDYDDKIISIGFEHDFKTGDVFEWCNTGTYWLIYLQDLTELAYFRGDIRKCSYEIEWDDESGNRQRTYIALRGPVETKIDYIQKHGISVDNPNYSLNILMSVADWSSSAISFVAKTETGKTALAGGDNIVSTLLAGSIVKGSKCYKATVSMDGVQTDHAYSTTVTLKVVVI